MCIDFIDINKVYLNDNFQLSIIYMLVDSTVGHQTLTTTKKKTFFIMICSVFQALF